MQQHLRECWAGTAKVHGHPYIWHFMTGLNVRRLQKMNADALQSRLTMERRNLTSRLLPKHHHHRSKTLVPGTFSTPPEKKIKQAPCCLQLCQVKVHVMKGQTKERLTYRNELLIAWKTPDEKALQHSAILPRHQHPDENTEKEVWKNNHTKVKNEPKPGRGLSKTRGIQINFTSDYHTIKTVKRKNISSSKDPTCLQQVNL